MKPTFTILTLFFALFQNLPVQDVGSEGTGFCDSQQSNCEYQPKDTVIDGSLINLQKKPIFGVLDTDGAI